MKKIKSIALLVLASAFLVGSLSSCCCPKAPEITSNLEVEDVSAG